jgi:5-methylcytosine-specific restriction enzyme A
MSPMAPRKPCNRFPCPELQPCKVHTKTLHDAQRGTANSRGYNYRWQQYTKHYLRKNPLCAMCQREGRVEAATLVDHIIPVQSADDPLFWDPKNHWGLSRRCHGIKTQDDIKKGLTRR